MLMGEYRHNMDAKGRVTIPSKYREELGETFYTIYAIDEAVNDALFDISGYTITG